MTGKEKRNDHHDINKFIDKTHIHSRTLSSIDQVKL